MGRSKFPGKPSKSINRKRISVLQIDDETTATTTATTTAPSTTTTTETTTTTTTTKEPEDEPLTVLTTTTAAAVKNNNKHNRDDDDEHDHGGNGQAKSNVIGGSNNSTSDNSSTSGKSVNGSSSGSNNSNGQKNGSTEASISQNDNDAAKVESSDIASNNSDNKPTTIAPNKLNTNEHIHNDNADEDHNDDDGDDDDDDDEDEDEDEDNESDEEDEDDEKNEITTPSISPLKRKNCNKKFQNLNLLKPEVMLPSSSKLKQQQQHHKDLNRFSPTIPINNPFAIESKNSIEKSHKKSEITLICTTTDLKSDPADNKTCSTIISTTPNTNNNNSNSNSSNSNSNDSTTNTKTANSTPTSTASKPKKSVTFKNILETSDDKSAVKKFYNPNNRIPLVSIMKKECMNRPLTYSRSSECIVRPSRLTEILKNKNNIDKLDALKFRSSTSSTNSTSPLNITGPFAISGLSRAFGAPADDEADKQDNCVKFRVGFEKTETNVEHTIGADGETIGANNTGMTSVEREASIDEDDDCDDEQQMIVDKHFVLPKRTRSSRVVKPNKRLVEDGIICKKSTLANKLKTISSTASTSTAQQHELLAPKQETTSTNSTLTTPLQKNYFGLGDYNDNNSSVDSLKMLTSPKESLTNFNDTKPNLSVLKTALNKSTTIGASLSSTTFGSFGALKSNSNFILRQPRLQFDSLNERSGNTLLRTPLVASSSSTTITAPKTAFSTTSTTITNSNNLQVGNNCSVCDSSIHSKVIQQARKYGTLACAVCRKFIAKITKKSLPASASPTLKVLQLQCKADGNCCIQPSVKSHSKNFKKIYKERCLACWLKKCLLHLQFSSGHRQRLSAALTPNVLKQTLADSKRLIVSTTTTTTTEANMSTMRDNEQLSISCLKKEPGLLSPNTLPTPRLSATINTTQQQLKWKATLEKPTEGLRINLKTNPLAENNITFGSTPLLLRPAILEKPLFLKTTTSSSSCGTTTEKLQVLDNLTLCDNAALLEIPNDSSEKVKSKRKHKDKERTKEHDKESQQKTAIVANNKSNESIAVNETDSTPLPATLNSSSTAVTTNHITETTLTTNTTTNNSTPSIIIPTISSSSTQNSPTNNATTAAVAVTVATAGSNSTDNLKRQRIDLKGPRVKHVCRSASIVLGQPIAMFGEDEAEEQSQINECNEIVNAEVANTTKATLITTTTTPTTPTTSSTNTQLTNNETTKLTTDVIDENDNCSSCKQQEIATIATKQQPIIETTATLNVKSSTTTENKSEIIEPTTKIATTLYTKALKPLLPVKNTKGYNINTTTTTQISKKYMRHFNYNNNSENIQQQLRRKDANASLGTIPAAMKRKSLISIDFWENYDPAEVCQTGFGLIITETVAQRALCFLCGSTGLDPLLFCACCCEPYHQYCVLDEYNLKHSSLDDTMASFLLDTSTAENTTNVTQLTQRLNWLCPRCTVCYTCNMSSGSKVKCQKCQKNYHSTCLGTSKRLLGADRPLICVNCLKCKSCSTTKVSKFVGNLPMCTSCFKLRKRGNYCPICQKCYDDNDFDLKMMECGDCNQWVHSKCEGLSDEQYNLLSTLPETIEFICKKCARRNEHSKQRAQEWRLTVMEEFKTGLLTVLKLLSKSRQACALLKLSPRKKINCSCGNITGRLQPKALLFNGVEREQLGSDGESQCSEDVYEFSECPTGSQLSAQAEKLKVATTTTLKCTCGTQNSYYSTTTQPQLSLIDIKKKIANNAYTSLAEFNYDMNSVIQLANCDELVISYKEIVSEQFPWFQNETKACTDALEEDMFESGSSSYGMNGGSGSSIDGGCSPEENEYGAAATIDMENNNQLIDLPADVEDVIFTYKLRQDARICLFCRKTGEGQSNDESRLLYCGHDCWVHINCAMWSAEVFEEIDGSLQNVHSAVSRGRMIKCTVCGNRGASVGCNVKSCGEHYHYPCARSINCAFLTDKSMYCPTHARDALARAASPNVSIETNFEVTRPVYVELDRKRKKLIDPTRVQFHIGSLEVKQLGTVFPRFSDSFEAIVPINFLCSRLYWSCKEPWKIVEYTVRTTIQNSFSTLSTLDVGRNFTVDHTNPNSSLVQLGLAQITRWHSSLARGETNEMDCSNAADFANSRNVSSFSKFLPEYLIHSQNSVLMSNADENTEEEPQTNADLLPPDLKDAIFEDLPHELLDGISMLDIFPKFMNYEELGNVGDCKTEAFLNDQSKDGVSIATTTATTGGTTSSNQMSDNDDTNNSSFSKQIELSNSWSSSSTTNSTSVNHVEDALLSAARSQFKRSLSVDCNKSEALFLKVGSAAVNATAAALKRRKLAKSSAEDVRLSLSQRHRTKKEAFTAAALARRQSQCTEADILGGQRTKTFTWSAAKRYMETVSVLEDAKDVHNIKLMQVDGVDDSITEYRIISAEAQLNGTVKCDRCHCSYRTYDSFQRHLATCEQLSTSESDSERAPSRSPPGSIGATIAASHLITADGLNNELSKLARNATATSTAASLPFIQAFQQATAAGIPLAGIQTTANIGGIPIANLQSLQAATATPGVQTLQNLQGLQNLQSLQNLQFQNLQPQTLGGGNFFISQAPQTSTNANGVGGNDDLQFFSNALQSLTANLNGTYTLAPTTGATAGFTVQPQATAQPQLIAVSTNPDGTQQIIQLPTGTTVNQQILQATPNGYQTLQASTGDKKIMMPIASKPLNNKVGAKSMPPPANKQKLKANTVKPIQSKIASNSMAATAAASGTTMQAPQITVLNAAGGNSLSNNAAQLLNQNLLQQLQVAANPQQQPILFQTAATTQQQPIIMQQPTQNLISFVTTDGSQNPQVQYLSIPTNDFKPQQNTTTPYITTTPANNAATNSLLQGATYLQTDASGNLVLTTTPAATNNGHLQMLSATPLNQTGQVIGTLIQPQTLQLNGNVLTTTGDSQQPVIIGGTTSATAGSGLEMIAAANAAAAGPQVILATQPMYYGLETIVQNTVMSSQQFVSTAMPGVLSQNASFSATTTQVFQASKIEPLVDIPAGYVVLNNVDTTPSIVQPQATAATQQQQQPTHSFLNATGLLQHANAITTQDQQSTGLETIYRIQQQQQTQSTSDNATTTTYQFATAQPIQQPQIVTAKITPQNKQRNNLTAKSTNSTAATKVQPQVINKVLPTSIGQQQQTQTKFTQKQQAKSLIQQQQQQQSTTNIFVRPSTMTTIPIAVSTAIDSLPTQHFIVTQARPATSICSTPIYETNISQYQTVSQQHQQQQQIYTTVQPMTATITLATAQQPVTTVATKPLTQTSNARKTNLIRPIHKAEVKPKVLKTVPNTSTLSTTANTKQQTEAMSTTTTLKMKPQEALTTTNLIQQIPALQAINTSNLQPAQQYSLITIAQPKQTAEIQQQPQQLNGVSQNITLQQSQPQTTYVYDQQQQQIIEYQQTEPLQQNIEIDAYQQQQQQQESTQNQHSNINSNNNNNNNNNRLQFSTSNSIYNSNVPTNIVNPIQFATTSTTSNMHTTTLTSRPTNRVLPMQQKQQQQDHNNKPMLNSQHHNNVNNSTKRQQQQQQQQQQPTKCYENNNASLKICYDTEVMKKDQQQTSPVHNYIQQEHQHEAQMQQHETFQVLHVQQQHENGEVAATIEFSVTELKNGDLQLLENQQHNANHSTNMQLEVVNNNLQNYEDVISATTDCLLDEKQHQKLLTTAYAADNNCEEANESMSSNIAQEDGDELQADNDEEDDDGFSLKMPTDDEDGMDLDQAISESDEPAVKEKISKILDNLTNDDCADSVTTATTVEAGAVVGMQHIQYMDTDLCESSNNNNNNNIQATNVEVNNGFIGNEVEDVAAAYMAQITAINQTAEPIVGNTLKRFKKELTTQITVDAITENKIPIDANKENASANKQTVLSTTLTTATTLPTAHAHPPHYSHRDPKKITGPHLLYEIQSEDGFTYKSTSITEVWEKVFEAVQVARRAHGLSPLPEGPLADMSGVQMIGLKTNALKYLIEQLPGVEKCNKYTPKYHKRTTATPNSVNNSSNSNSSCGSMVSTAGCDASSSNGTLDYGSDQEELHENFFECVRCEPYRQRSEYDMFSWLASKHRKQPIQVFVQPSDTEIVARRGTGSNLPMAMKYRTLKETYKDYVGVFRSHIHGRGLYCTKDIEAGEMVIEYAGELIRSTLTDKRERNYNSRGIGCYMFKIDDNLVVDATMRGNAARFINHSCEPNCYSKVVDILGHKHIIIFALRRIVQGEELTYDYKFPFEDEKIPCSCGSKKCRKYLN